MAIPDYRIFRLVKQILPGFVVEILTGGPGLDPDPTTPELDARTYALREFAKFLALQDFQVEGSDEKFSVHPDDIHLEWPDYEKDLKFPSIAFKPGRGTYESFGLGAPDICDNTVDPVAGTALLSIATYVETIGIKCWASSIPERRAMMARIETAMHEYSGSYALKLQVPGYYDQIASFVLDDRTLLDDPDSARKRRRGQFTMTMSINLVRQVKVATFNGDAQIVGEVVDSDDGLGSSTLTC